MIKPKIMKFKNPQTGLLEEVVRWPTILTYGLDDKEMEVLKKALPSKDIKIGDITGEATDICAIEYFMAVINPFNTPENEMQVFIDFYKDFKGAVETYVFTKNKPGIAEAMITVNPIVYNDIAEYEHNIKYEILKALKKKTRIDSYSNSIAQSMIILMAIRNNPYITTKQLAEKIERSERTVQRYIDTIRCAGEWIEYDRAKKGWHLFENKSILLDEF